MAYVERIHALQTCQRMKEFHSKLTDLYLDYGMNLESNRGRRNILMSAPMEHFLAQELRKTYVDVENDGRTGKADIVIKLLHNDHEIECKLTSPHASGTVAFQSDYETLDKKGSLDYMYIVANEDFDGFVAIYFKDLTVKEFRGLSPGARGKVQMYKHKGMDKATVLIGDVINLKEVTIKKLQNQILDIRKKTYTQVKLWEGVLLDTKISQPAKIKKYQDQIENLREASLKRADKIKEKINSYQGTLPRYTMQYEEI